MKKMFALLAAVVIFAAMLPVFAFANDSIRYIKPMETNETRLKLRADPSTDGKVLGKYYAGTKVEVLSESKGWSKVNVGGNTGYMMSKYLVTYESGYSISPPIGQIIFPKNSDGTTDLRSLDGSSLLERISPEIRNVYVLGTISNDYLHVMFTDTSGEVKTGLILSSIVSQAENFSTAIVKGKKGNSFVNVRNTPSTSDEPAGTLYPGVQVFRLFDPEPNDEWTKIRVGRLFGFIKTDFLDTSTQDNQLFFPSWGFINIDKYDLGQSDFFHPELSPEDYAEFGKIDKAASWYTIDANTPLFILGTESFDEYESYYCTAVIYLPNGKPVNVYFGIPKKYVTLCSNGSISSQGKIKSDTETYMCDANGKIVNCMHYSKAVIAKKGYTFVISGSYPEPDEKKLSGMNCGFGFISPNAKYVRGSIRYNNFSFYDCLIPINHVEFDSNLFIRH